MTFAASPLTAIAPESRLRKWLPYLLLSFLLHGLLVSLWQRPSPVRLNPAAPLQLQIVLSPVILPPPIAEADAAPAAQSRPAQNSAPTQVRSAIKPVKESAHIASVAAALPAAASVPQLDLDSAKALARSIAIEPERKTLIAPRENHLKLDAPVAETQLAKDLKKAVRPDCKQAYEGMGLLAAPMLLKDAVTDSGCQW